MLTERSKFCILTYNAATQDIVTTANGDVKDRSAQLLDCGMRAMIDTECKAIVLTLYAGLLKVIPFTAGEASMGRATKGKGVVGRRIGEIGGAFNVR